MSYINKAVLASVVLATFVTASGCATIVTGSTQSVQIDSTPGNAVVKINNLEQGQTPVRVELSRSQKVATVQIELPGFEPENIELRRSVNGWVWGNILIGGLIGLVIDASSGAMYAHKLPAPSLDGELVEIPASAKEKPEGVDLWIDVTLTPNEKYSKVGQLTPAT